MCHTHISSAMSSSRKVLHVFQRSGFKVSHTNDGKQPEPPIFVCSCSTCVILVAIRCAGEEAKADSEYVVLHFESMMTMENLEASLGFLSVGGWHVTLLGGSNASTHFNHAMNYAFVHDFVHALNETFTKATEIPEEKMHFWAEARLHVTLADGKDNTFVHTAAGILDVLLAKKSDNGIYSLKADPSFMNFGMRQHHKYVITPIIETDAIGVKAFYTTHLEYDLDNRDNIDMVYRQLELVREHNLVKRLLIKDKADAYFTYLKTAFVQVYEGLPLSEDSEKFKLKVGKASELIERLISEETDGNVMLTVVEHLAHLKDGQEEKVSFLDLKARALDPTEIDMAC